MPELTDHLRRFGNLSGLTAVVTGGASGIGASVVARLRSDGAAVAVLDLRVGPGEWAIACDVTSTSSVGSAVAQVARTSGTIDILVNCAGVGAVGDVTANQDSEWAHVFDVNVTGIARVTRAALPWLRASPSAAIVNVSSIAANTGLPDRALYSASKGAVSALTRAMAADHLREGIRVNSVSPGTTDTPWVERLIATAEDAESAQKALMDRQPHGRLVRASEIADVIAYLANPASGSTTGVDIAVDGGMQTLRLPPLRR